ncbi:putative membrane protein [Brucella lupini]|uniref:Putative membrane protein n=1 Tax=Brucella lupini TaxID=255457 RepID=A0A256GYP5_9HYPH|nr:putative membrane protein [Brucella lupini]
MEQSLIRNVEFSTGRRTKMLRAMILWLMGVPLVVVLLIWYFFF